MKTSATYPQPQVASQHLDDMWTRRPSPLPTAMLVWYGEQPWGITPLAGHQGQTQDLPCGKPVNWRLGHGSFIEEVLCCFSKSSINFKGHTGKKITNFDPNLGVSGLYLSMNSPMALKWCTKLDVVQKRCPIVFQGHASYFKVTQAKKLMIWIKFEKDY